MTDCRNYRYQENPREEWCREGIGIPSRGCGNHCPFYEECETEQELEERRYPDET